jgi:hypothetical protein
LFDLAAIPLGIGTVASVAVTWLYHTNFHRSPDTLSTRPRGQPGTASGAVHHG